MSNNIHPFEAAGLGQAPFRFLRATKNVYSAAPGHSQPGGTCAYCANGILYEYWIRSHDGVVSTVGCECIRKIDRSDNKLATDAQRAAAQFRREAAEARREAQRQARRQAHEAELQAQRERNGGLTDREVVEAQEKAERARAKEHYSQENEWLIVVMRAHSKYRHDFCDSMSIRLAETPLREMSSRCISIMRDIYAKSHGRRNSKAYKQAEVEFDNRIG